MDNHIYLVVLVGSKLIVAITVQLYAVVSLGCITTIAYGIECSTYNQAGSVVASQVVRQSVEVVLLAPVAVSRVQHLQGTACKLRSTDGVVACTGNTCDGHLLLGGIGILSLASIWSSSNIRCNSIALIHLVRIRNSIEIECCNGLVGTYIHHIGYIGKEHLLRGELGIASARLTKIYHQLVQCYLNQ